MKLTIEQTEELEKWVSAFYSPKDIAIIMQLDENEFISAFNDKNSDIRKTCDRARLKQLGEIRISIMNQAKAGSGPAQSLAIKIITDYELENDE